MSFDYSQALDDHDALQSTGSVGDAYDNALAESWVDSLKTELIADRVWRTRQQLELAVVEYIGWFNNDRLHSSLGYLPPTEFDQRQLEQLQLPLTAPISDNGSVADGSPTPADGLTTRRIPTIGAEIGADGLILAERAPARTAPTYIPRRAATAGLTALRLQDPRSVQE